MIEIEVIGIPAPQGSKSAVLIGGKARLIEGSSTTGREKHKSWRQGVATAGRDYLALHPRAPIDEPCRLSVTFRFPLPASDQYRTLHSTKPDLSKLTRSTEDALVDAGLMRDDSLFCEHRMHKLYCHGDVSPGATIVVELLGDDEAENRKSLKEIAKQARRSAR